MDECKPLPAPVSRHTDCASQPPMFSAHMVLGLHPVLPLPRSSGTHWN